MTVRSDGETPRVWIGIVCVFGPNFVAAHGLEREGWVPRSDLGLNEYEGVFFCKKFKSPEEAVHRAGEIADRLGVMSAGEAIEADRVLDASDLPDP